MKKVIALNILLVITASCYAQPAKSVSSDFNKLAWLHGTWNRTAQKPGRSGHERWIKISDSEYQGWGVTMKGQDTTFVEKLKLVAKDSDIFYVADVAENKAPVWFKLTEIKADGFTCENQEHDFPKKIVYQLTGNTLKATVSAGEKAIDFVFEKAVKD